MTLLRTPHLSVFAVEDTSAQLVWRHLRRGELVLEVDRRSPVVVDLGPEGSDPRAGAVVVDGLPAGATVPIRARGPALGASVTLTATTLAALPGEELTRIATISDLHLGAQTFGHRGTIAEDPTPEVPHPYRCSEAALDAAHAWGADTVAVKGDITNNAQVDQWRSYARLIRSSPVPVVGVPGNHDRAFRSGSSGLSPEDAAAVFSLQLASPLLVVDRPGVRLVLVDSTSGQRNQGRVGPEADAIVQAVTETDPGSVALVLLHHQLHQHPVHEGWPVGVARNETVGLLDRLADTRTPTLVSSGHTHRHRRWVHRGVVVTQVGSTKDYPGVWGGYVISAGGLRQTVQRVAAADCIVWTDHTRRAAAGTWRWIAPGSLAARCFTHTWSS